MKEIEATALSYARQGLTEEEIIEKLVNYFSINQNAATYQAHEAYKKIKEIDNAKEQYVWSFFKAILIALLMLVSLTIPDNQRAEMLKTDTILSKYFKMAALFPFIGLTILIYFSYESWKQYKLMKEDENWRKENELTKL